MAIGAISSYGVIVRCGTPAEALVRSLEQHRLAYSSTDGLLLGIPVAQSPADAARFHATLAQAGCEEGRDYAMVLSTEGVQGRVPDWLRVNMAHQTTWSAESLAALNPAERARYLEPGVVSYELHSSGTPVT